MSGARIVVRTVRAPNGVPVTLAGLPASALGLAVLPGRAAGTARKLTAADALSSSAAAVALDGPMFIDTGDTSRLRYRLLDRAAGIDFPGSADTRDRGGTLSVLPDGGSSIAAGATTAPGAVVAVQVYPLLVRDGRPVEVSATESNRARVWRAALGRAPSGGVVLAVGPATLSGWAAALAGLGIPWAGYTDGGSSTDLRTSAGPRWGFPGAPRVPAWIVGRGELDLPAGAAGAGGGASLALAALGLAGLLAL